MIIRAFVILVSIILSLLTAGGSAYAQQSAPPQPAPAAEILQQQVDQLNSVIVDLTGQISQMNAIDPKHREAVQEARGKSVQSYYESLVSLNQNGDRLREHQQKVFAWQIKAANCLLVVVMIISLSGVLFAGYEMLSARRLIASGVTSGEKSTINAVAAAIADNAQLPAGQAPENGAQNGGVSPATTITIEPTKIHITSAVIGIIILGLSLGFLYLFLKEVYAIKVFEITDTGGIKLSSSADSAPDKKPNQPPAESK